MSINNDQSPKRASLGEAILRLKIALTERVSVQIKSEKEQRQLEVNRYLKLQKIEVQKAAKQIKSSLALNLGIALSKLLMETEKAEAINLLNKKAVKDVDVQAANDGLLESKDWSEKVIHLVNKEWEQACEKMLINMKKHESILKNFKKFAPFQERYNSVRSSIDGNRHANLFAVKDNFVQEVENLISELSSAVRELGPLPENLFEFLSEAGSSNGFDFEKFNNSENDGLRKILKENGFYSNLTLRMKN